MLDLIEKRLSLLGPFADRFGHLPRGIEKESLRITDEGRLATTPHPLALGSALTNPRITTDYSESLIELVTPVCESAEAVYQSLADLHSFVYQSLDRELLWNTSMPCIVPDDDLIPVAAYGTSNVGMMKHVYRLGLGHRYGRVMQTIAGVHYNVSMPEAFWTIDRDHHILGDTSNDGDIEYRSRHYFGMVRNIHRYCWILLYLCGASPAICKSFVRGREHNLDELDSGTVYLPYATSLRMSDLGYQNNAQDSLDVRYNNLIPYTDSLIKATNTPHPAYEAIGIRENDTWKQLNTNILQIENEYYAVVRPKRVINSGEKPSCALRERGVEYVEIRVLDLDPFEPNGISIDTIRFLDVFALFCMLAESPEVTDTDQTRFAENQARTVLRGRAPDTNITTDDGAQVPLRTCASDLLDLMEPVAEFLDTADANTAHRDALKIMRTRVDDPEKTPSARVLREMASNSERFADFGIRQSRELRQATIEHGLSAQTADALQADVVKSIAEQQTLEAGDTLPFAEYLAQYMDQ